MSTTYTYRTVIQKAIEGFNNIQGRLENYKFGGELLKNSLDTRSLTPDEMVSYIEKMAVISKTANPSTYKVGNIIYRDKSNTNEDFIELSGTVQDGGSVLVTAHVPAGYYDEINLTFVDEDGAAEKLDVPTPIILNSNDYLNIENGYLQIDASLYIPEASYKEGTSTGTLEIQGSEALVDLSGQLTEPLVRENGTRYCKILTVSRVSSGVHIPTTKNQEDIVELVSDSEIDLLFA